MQFGSYRLVEKLGEGGTGDVHLAVPTSIRGVPSPVVIKRLWIELTSQDRIVERFLHEAELAVAVSHPNVAGVYDVGRVGDTYYIAGEFVPGWSILEIVEQARQRSVQLPIGCVISIVLDLLAGLHAIHNSVHPGDGLRLEAVHRDLSARNLMVDEGGRGVVIDLGLGKSAAQSWKTKTGAVMGSPGYMSPEQAFGLPLDQRSDLYSIAVVLFELLTLEPFVPRGPALAMVLASAQAVPRSVRAIRAEVAERLDQAISWGLAHRPDERIPTAEQFSKALLEAATPVDAGRLVDMLFGDEVDARRRQRAEAIEAVDAAGGVIEPTVVLTSLVRRPGVEVRVGPIAVPMDAYPPTRPPWDSRRSFPATAPRSRVAVPWLVALGIVLFASGVVVGSRQLARREPVVIEAGAMPVEAPALEPRVTPRAAMIAPREPALAPAEPEKPVRREGLRRAPHSVEVAVPPPAVEDPPRVVDERSALLSKASELVDDLQRRKKQGQSVDHLLVKALGIAKLTSTDAMKHQIQDLERDLEQFF